MDLGEGEMGKAWASCCWGCSAVDRGRSSQVESMARWTGDSKESSCQVVLRHGHGLRSSDAEKERIRGSILKFTQDTG